MTANPVRLWLGVVLVVLSLASCLLPLTGAALPKAPDANPERSWFPTFPGSPDQYSISGDGTTVLYSGGMNETYLMNIDSDVPIKHFNFSSRITTISLSTDGSRYAVITREHLELHVFDSTGDAPIWKRTMNGLGYMLAMSPKGDRVILGDWGVVYLLDASNGNELQNWTLDSAGHLSSQPAARFSSDGQSVALLLQTGITVLDIGNSVPRWTFEPPAEGNRSFPELRDFAVSDDLSRIAVDGFYPRLLWFLDGKTGKQLWNRSFDALIEPAAVSMDSSGKKLAVITNEGLLYRIDADTAVVTRTTMVGIPDLSGIPLSGHIAMSADGTYIAVAADIMGGKIDPFRPSSALYLFRWDSPSPMWRYELEMIWPDVSMTRDSSHVIVQELGASRIFGRDGGVRTTVPPGPVPTSPVVTAAAVGVPAVIVFGAIGAFGTTEAGRLAVHAPLFGLYTRLKKDNVVDHQVRSRILSYVTAHPGAHYSAIRDELGLANGHTAYHLKVLCREGQLRPRRHGQRVHFYIPQSESDRAALPEGTVDEIILTLLRRSPGATQSELSVWSGFDQSTVSRALQRLVQLGQAHTTEQAQVHYYWPDQMPYTPPGPPAGPVPPVTPVNEPAEFINDPGAQKQS